MNVSERLARFVAETESVPEQAIGQARRAVLDTLGVALAGSREESARALADWIREQDGRGDATVLGRAFLAPAADAALANGTAAHALDFDDVSLPMRGHPSAPLLPAALALAEKAASGGRDLLTAFVLGFEVETRLGRAIGEPHYGLGWHATSTLGTVGAAAACARLLRLDAGRTQMALGVAASFASGLQQNFGTMTKPLHAGWAARNGVVAAELAARGFTADPHAFEGVGGFLRAMSGGGDIDLAPFEAVGDPFEITSSGLGVKLYPCCYATHRAIDAALEIRDYLLGRHPSAVFGPSTIFDIDVEVSMGTLIPLRGGFPATGLEGKFSLEYCLAAALVDGTVTLASFSDEAIRRPNVRELMSRIDVTEVGPPSEFPIGGRAHIQLGFNPGKGQFAVVTDSRVVEVARGDPSRPLSWEELAGKFRDCTEPLLSDEARGRVVGLVERLDELPDVRALTEALAAVTTEARR